MKKRFCAIALVLVLAVSFVFPCFGASVAAVGSGTFEDPFVVTSTNVYYSDSVPMPFYVDLQHDGRACIYSSEVVFDSGSTYYLYVPHGVNTVQLYSFGSATSPSNVLLQTLTSVYSSDNWDVYSFVASADGYGCATRFDVTGFRFYYDTALHEPVEFGKVAKQMLGGVLDVGSQFVSWVVGTPLLLVAFTIMVTVTGVGIIRRITKGV